MKILFTEENAHEYLQIRQLLEEQKGFFKMDWATNYDVALKKIEENDYDVHLIGYNPKKLQQRFVASLYKHKKNIPIILLTKHDELIETTLIDQYQTYFLSQKHLSCALIERSIYYLSHLNSTQNHQEIFQIIFNKAFEFIALIKPNGIVKDINQTALRFLNSTLKGVKNHLFWEMPWVTHSKRIEAYFKKALEGKILPCKIKIQEENRQNIVLDFIFTPITNAQGEILWILAEGRHLEEQISHLSSHDQLTDLPNRHLFIEYLEDAMSRAKQHKEYYIAVLLINLKRFRVINAALGHDMGDWLLMKMSQRLETCLENKNILAHAGGNEFIILLDDMQDFAEATTLATTINEVLGRLFSMDGYDISMSSDIGIAYYTDQKEANDVLRDADAAMLHTKNISKTGCTVFRPEMHHQVISRLQMETDLQKAIKLKNFVLRYQPQIELVSNKLVGMESLIRFQHPKNGLISPLEFISVLEDTGSIIPIGEWVLQTACSHLISLLEANLPINHVTVNLSAYQFRNKNFIRKIIETLEESGLQPESLELEITENLLLEDIDSAIKTLKYLKNLGIRVTIDDFGTGYSSLIYLKRLPADFIKIDKTFIGGVISSPEDTAITVATIDMAHALGLGVIAAGVETIEQHNFLYEFGCDFAQGYLYAAPMADINFLEWAREYNQKLKVQNE